MLPTGVAYLAVEAAVAMRLGETRSGKRQRDSEIGPQTMLESKRQVPRHSVKEEGLDIQATPLTPAEQLAERELVVEKPRTLLPVVAGRASQQPVETFQIP